MVSDKMIHNDVKSIPWENVPYKFQHTKFCNIFQYGDLQKKNEIMFCGYAKYYSKLEWFSPFLWNI